MTPSPSRPLTIVADDLTGACDTGALFTGCGRVSVAVWPARAARAAVRVIDTESRALAATDAAARVRRAAGAARGSWFKKVDSTLRGPVGAELDVLMSALGAATALVCPAFPAQGRIVSDRVLYIDGAPLAETTIARDPTFPARAASSSVVELLRPQLDRALAWIPLDRVRAGHESLAARLQRLAGMVIVADAETDADLDALVAAATSIAPSPLLAGAAGLARALAARLGCLGAPVDVPSVRRWLVVAGSRHPATRAQIAAARAAGIDVVASADTDEGDRAAVAAALAAQALERIERDRVDALVVSGGETALALFAALGADTFELEGVPGEGLALLRLEGPRDRLSVVTKAGAFGAPELLVALVKEPVA